VRIVLDAMGGDNAPQVEVKGTVDAIKKNRGFDVILVGKQEEIEKCLAVYKLNDKERARIQIQNATEVITMSDEPAKAFKQKPDASMIVSAKLVKDGKADAFVSAGNTGAMLVTSLLTIGRIPGVIRPAILVPMPSKSGTTAVLDGGANVDCKPAHLAQFAIMGSLYASHIFKIENPRVGVMSVGEEEGKGNELSIEAKDIIKTLGLNFKGNVEGRDVFNGNADVIVCDGFVGNIILKAGEGAGLLLVSEIKQGAKKSLITMIGGLLMKKVFKQVKDRINPDVYGGAPLLGIKKPVIISHGSASAEGIKNAILVARQCVEEHINDEIEREVKKVEAKSE